MATTRSDLDPATDPSPGSATGSDRPALLSGVAGALIGATCCIGPAVGVAMGLGTGSFLVGMGNYRFQAFAVGAVAAAVGLVLLLRRRRASCPTDASFRALRARWLDVAIVTFAVTYALGRFAVPRLIEAL